MTKKCPKETYKLVVLPLGDILKPGINPHEYCFNWSSVTQSIGIYNNSSTAAVNEIHWFELKK